MSRNRRQFTLVAPSPHEVPRRAVRNGNTIHETYNTNVSRQYLLRKRTRTDRDLRQSCKRLYERHRLESACRDADDIQMASISGKLLAISTRNLDAGPPSREKGEQTVLADSYSIVLQPLIWISYGHPIRRLSPVRSYVVEGVIDFHGNPWCV